MTSADGCEAEHDHCTSMMVKAKTEEGAMQPGTIRCAARQDDESRGQTCSRCAMMDHLVVLYREKDTHAANALQARKQIETDEVDVARLLLAAARYQESARKRTGMIKRETQRERESISQVELKMKEIGDLQRQLYVT